MPRSGSSVRVEWMTDGDEYEKALRSLPEAHSLALRLSDAGVADDVICGYLHIEGEGLELLLELARRKLRSALGKPSSRPE